jgi:hypothetical protein
MDIAELQHAIGEWSEATFDDNSPAPKLHHLKEEVDELLEAPMDRAEYADCLILLLDAARKAGIGADELVQAAYQKLEINKRRLWGEPDENGVVKHIAVHA